MKFFNTEVFGWEAAIRGMRNPLESWAKSDTFELKGEVHIGQNDMNLMQRLIKGGSEHRKYLRYIHVQVDITAPIYWWKEFDKYQIAVVTNSTSTMHKLANTPITLDCFEIDNFCGDLKVFDNEPYNIDEFMQDCTKIIIDICETLRKRYIETKDIRYWKELIRWLPESWLQTRTVDLNYEVLRNIYHQRKSHKLTEWSVSFINWLKTLPYAEELIFYENNNEDKLSTLKSEIKKLGKNPFQADLMRVLKENLLDGDN